MQKFLVHILYFILFLFFFTHQTEANVNPLARPNNKVGIHILFPDELSLAAKLINTNGGEWGYVTIPIQSGDRDLAKWQKFMDEAKTLKVIPIIRIASEGDYFNTKVWRKPTETDVLDFANFLASLSWPTKNRYVVVFNEVNRADEWGGTVSPSEYATLLSYAVTVFKSKNQDFFIISAGLDNAAANTSGSMNSYDFIHSMNVSIPGIFLQIDGLGSHSYPNPAFAKPPTDVDQMSIATFRYEDRLIQAFSGKSLPIFITETGWSSEKVSPFIVSLYLQTAFASVWADTNVVAVTPFLLKAGSPFAMFSFISSENTPTAQYKILESIPKIKGIPELAPEVLGEKIPQIIIEEKIFSQKEISTEFAIPDGAKIALKWFLKMPIQ